MVVWLGIIISTVDAEIHGQAFTRHRRLQPVRSTCDWTHLNGRPERWRREFTLVISSPPRTSFPEPHTLPRAEPLTQSHSLSTSTHSQGCSAKRWARSAHLHEIKVLRERRGSGGAKRVVEFKDLSMKNDRKNVALGDVDKDDVLVVSERAVVLNSPEPHSLECNNMSYMKHGGLFLFEAHVPIYTSFVICQL